MISIDVQSAIEAKHRVMFSYCEQLEKRRRQFQDLIKQLTIDHQHELSQVCQNIFLKTVRNKSEQVKVNVGGGVYVDMADQEAIDFAKGEIERIEKQVEEIKQDLGEDVILVDMVSEQM